MPEHIMVPAPVLSPEALAALVVRYAGYRRAVLILGSSHTSVAERRELLGVRDQFERELRDGLLDRYFGIQVLPADESELPRA